jgi:hypothetical protein
MSRHIGLPPASQVRAADQLQKTYPPAAGVQPLPTGQPGRATGVEVGIKDPGTEITFLVVGDTGGIENPTPQDHVAAALEQAVDAGGVAFIDHVGDICYYNGDPGQWVPQFYQPYAHVRTPIVGIAGNHDGDPTGGVPGAGISSFMANMCASTPAAPPGDPDLEFGRDTQTQPYCDWTLDLDAVTIIGVWSNVPSGGHLYPSQTAWLQAELAAAPTDRPVIVQLHHPPYSVDAHHGGSATMGAALDAVFEAAKRWPQLVLSGHVHDMQRFTRVVDLPNGPAGAYSQPVSYIVIGNGGYRNLHELAGDATPGEQLGGGVTFEYGDASGWGYLKLTIASARIAGEYVQVARDGTVTHGADTFTISAGAQG